MKHRGTVYSMQMINVNGKNECMLHESDCMFSISESLKPVEAREVTLMRTTDGIFIVKILV